jgi:hypothetical protein
MAQEEWITMTDAALRLGTTPSTISRVVKGNKEIKTKRDSLDKRVRLVDYKKLEEIFKSSYKYQG